MHVQLLRYTPIQGITYRAYIIFNVLQAETIIFGFTLEPVHSLGQLSPCLEHIYTYTLNGEHMQCFPCSPFDQIDPKRPCAGTQPKGGQADPVYRVS